MLYNKVEDVKIKLTVIKDDYVNNIIFTSNSGKFGTDEILDRYEISSEELLSILQNHFDK